MDVRPGSSKFILELLGEATTLEVFGSSLGNEFGSVYGIIEPLDGGPNLHTWLVKRENLWLSWSRCYATDKSITNVETSMTHGACILLGEKPS